MGGVENKSMSNEERIGLLETKLQELENRILLLETANRNPTPVEIASGEEMGKLSPLTVTLLGKDFHKANFRSGDVNDSIDLVLLFKSNLDKDVRAFTGTVNIKDLFDRLIMKLSLTHIMGVSTGGTAEWRGGIPFNEFLAPHRNLLEIELKDITTSFDLESVIYTDGTRESFS